MRLDVAKALNVPLASVVLETVSETNSNETKVWKFKILQNSHIHKKIYKGIT